MTPSFEQVDPEERRFRPIELPEFDHTLTREQLSKVDEITGERWKLDNVIGQKIDWVIRHQVEMWNGLSYIEMEVRKSKRFREWIWIYLTVIGAVVTIAGKYFKIL
jgi:hypothetical protein